MTPGESHNEWYQYYCSNICPFNNILHLQYRTLDMSVTCNCTLLQQSLSKPIFYGDLVDQFKRIVEKPSCSDPFKKDHQTL